MERLSKYPAVAVLGLLFAGVFALRCSNPPEPSEDADIEVVDGDTDAAHDGDFVIAEPEPPAPPVFTPCPEGWREVIDEESGLVTCDPWPEGGPHECGDDEAHFPGEPMCSRIGTACPEGDWAEDLPTDVEVLYVLAGAGDGGDGTRESPYGSIAEAVEAASSGTVVAVGKGIYDEAVNLPSGVILHGACVAETLVSPSEPSEEFGTVNVEGRNTGVRNLRVSGRRIGVMLSGGPAFSIHLEDLLVEGAEVLGLLVTLGGSLSGRTMVVRDMLSRQSDDSLGRGLNVESGAKATVRRAVFERNRELGIFAATAGTELTLEDVVVLDTLERACAVDGCAGFGVGDGLGALCGGRMELSRFRVSGSARCGLILAHGVYFDESGNRVLCDQGGTVDLHDGVISNNAIGVNIQTEGFDIDRLTDNVIFRDNGIDLDMTDLPVPEMTVPEDL